MEPKDHVRREPLPWQPDPDPWLTECGRNTKTLSTISHSQWREIYQEWQQLRLAWFKANPRTAEGPPPGIQAPNICGTCWDRAPHYPSFWDNPITALYGAIERGGSGWYPGPELNQMGVELLALGRLYKENGGRFHELCRDERDRAADRAAARRGRSRGGGG